MPLARPVAAVLRGGAAVAVLALSAFPAWAQSHARPGRLPVSVNEAGVMLSLPAGGLVLAGEVGGPVLAEPFAEWFAVAFDGPDGRLEAVGSGRRADPAGRPRVSVVGHHAGESAAVSVTRAGPLEIRHEFVTPAGSDVVLLTVILKNKGRATLSGVTYAREWSTAPGPAAPRGLARAEWRARDLPYKASDGRLFVFRAADAPPAGAAAAGAGPPTFGDGPDGLPLDVPLAFWTHPDWPAGLPIGATNGISFGDYDADGYADIYAHAAGLLWRNVAGTTWELGADFSALLPPATFRYGASFGDYDNDGLPDLAGEPRNVDGGIGKDTCLRLLRNAGGGSFVDVTLAPGVITGDPCELDSETACWGDTDGDGRLDLFLPVYPAWAIFPGPGNLFLHSEGQAPGGGLAFVDRTVDAGLTNPAGTERPEGAQMCDYDGDGDLDLFSNGTIYQNISTFLDPSFRDVSTAAGLQFRDKLDEGLLLTDYDMDGDFDLFVSYEDAAVGNRIFESRGDGSFFLVPADTIVNWFTGVGLGLSAADWDNDGDPDITTRQVFRRNMFVENGVRQYLPAVHQVDLSHLSSATPAWGDWDHDGDLDSAIGNWVDVGHFYDNELYGPATPDAERRHVRVRVVRDKAIVPAGLETEYGAAVEIVIPGEADAGIRRRQFVASGGGYLNQDEYVLHFALPEDPAPGDPGDDVDFSVSVDFPGVKAQGLWRVDRHVNPALGDIDLADLSDREITVFRSGRVIVDGASSLPPADAWPRLTTTNNGLTLPAPGVPVPLSGTAPGPNWWVGLDLRTKSVPGVVLREIVLDGQLDLASTCGPSDFNVAVWSVTGGAPSLLAGSAIEAVTSSRNGRTFIPVDVPLPPNGRYRVVAKVTSFRALPISAGNPANPVLVSGSISYADATPCTGVNMGNAGVNPLSVPMVLRYATAAPGVWADLGFALPGTLGPPHLTGSGTLAPSTLLTLDLDDARPGSLALLFIGLSDAFLPAMGGVMVPSPDLLIVGLPIDGAGDFSLTSAWPSGLPSGFSMTLQAWIPDPVAVFGYAASNGLKGTTP